MRLIKNYKDLFAAKARNAAEYTRRHSLLMPMLLSFCFLIAFVLLTITIWFSQNVRTTLEETIYDNAEQHAAITADQLRVSFEDCFKIAAHLKLIARLSPRSFQSNAYSAYMAIKEYNITSFKYSDLVICYKDNQLLLSVYGTCLAPVCFPEVGDAQELMETILSSHSVSLLTTAAFGADQADSRLLLVHPLSGRHTAVFVLNKQLLSSFASAIIDMKNNSVQALYDMSGTVLWSTRTMDEQTQNTVFAHIQKNLSGKKLTLDGINYIYSHVYISHGTYLVTLDEISTQFDELNTAIYVLSVICISILILGAAMLIFSIRRGYVPIAHLVSNIKGMLPQQKDGPTSDIATLQHAISQYSELVHESTKNTALLSSEELRKVFILRIICGQYSDPDELSNLCYWLKVDFPHPYFFACILQFDHLLNEQEREYIDTHLRHGKQDPSIYYFCLSPDGNSAVGIVNIPSSNHALLHTFGEQLLKTHFSLIHATVGMGQIYDNIASLGKSYIEAHAAIDYRLIKGKHTWITYDEVSVSGGAQAYPEALLEAYISALRMWNVQDIWDSLQRITDFIRQGSLSLQQVKCICVDLTSALLREINSLDNRVAYKLNSAYDVFNIAEYESVSELAQKIADFSQIIRQHVMQRDTSEDNVLIQQCIACMQENISNAQFSLSSLSEQFNITPQTLRRKFKEATGQTLSDYMIRLRIDRAKHLLTDTDLDISEICIQCGYLDPSSFIRLFKAEVGVPPGKFRESIS